MGEFGGFGGRGFGGLPRPRRLPSNVLIQGTKPNKETKILLVDSSGRLVIVQVGPRYIDQLPVPVPATVGTLFSNASGYGRVMLGVGVINITAIPVALSLYLCGNAETPTNSNIWGAPGVSVPAGGVWEWSGRWPIDNGDRLAGLAASSDSLIAFVSLEMGVDDLV